MRSKITDKINSIWNISSRVKNLAYVNETIDDYNAIIVKINKFKLEFGDTVDVTNFKRCYDEFIYNIFNLDKSRYTATFDEEKLEWLQFTTITGKWLFAKNDIKLSTCTNKFIIYIMRYLKQLNDIRTSISEFKKKYNDNDKVIDKISLLYNTYFQYNETDEFNKRIALINSEAFNPNDIEFYTLKEGKYYHIRIMYAKIIKSEFDLCDSRIIYMYKMQILDKTKDEICGSSYCSKMNDRFAKLVE